ncbi:MAG: thioredoxin domain-containing protein [Patescibacteria group bacterium]|nr:thioredoxin domain-containing protein [Patescibacteria group bacterium]
MFCVIALIIFSILGIFSATHRALALEALDCVFRRVTFRPCKMDFKEKIKNKILAKLLNRSDLAARMFNKHFELLSWIFFILMVASTFYIVKGGYNYYFYGSCNGLNQSGFCAFDPSGENNKITQLNTAGSCSAKGQSEKDLTLSGVDLSSFPKITADSKNTIVFIGCYECDYSRKAYPEIRRLAKTEKTNLIFAHYPAVANTGYLSDIAYCAYSQDQEKFWALNDYLFTADKTKLSDTAFINQALDEFGFNASGINKCLGEPSAKNIIKNQFKELQKTKLYGTPTIFINGQVFVGPKPYRVYRSAIKKFIFF